MARGGGSGGGMGLGGDVADRDTISIAVVEHPASTRSSAAASRGSIMRPNFWVRFTAGLARVKFSRSDAKRLRRAASAAHNPLSWASDRATMCSMSVSRGLANQRPV